MPWGPTPALDELFVVVAVTLISYLCVQDVGLSKDLNENFRKHLANTGDTLDVDFSIQVRGKKKHA
jgi:hypothetical protein